MLLHVSLINVFVIVIADISLPSRHALDLVIAAGLAGYYME